ncbi:KH domain-containing protein [Metabacillus sediminilitoris]|uniref:RNA-binding protein KhpA n=1 Tax=Metabacillus sediminilitoris TaxID=2567941 RepID=A0A4S4C6Z0_9BACI|nr:KH domain-containing protein [Metabacillus sediminilitoris]QGQ46882.1 KH domain-containing protein [Metabacillus sediminilitoris]THF83030.1 KH domain-containing protein [Metabacillus sediminilitoris]
MKELIEAIVKPLVDSPEHVEVNELETENQITFRLSVQRDDIGKVIGKQGRIAKAIRTVVYAAGSTSSKRILLEIND